ncbi:hypothetical protein JTE90_003259 [Oedothorax gibbosus]|uniref:Uncharacterized protein n=1 Tax=Oedothorax gibbosus TaxID=931172 RepID=A0AAV6V6F9_9ARAC|nr:hypothetical protein JTE90_003259 [Oedothorax gibbosus]
MKCCYLLICPKRITLNQILEQLVDLSSTRQQERFLRALSLGFKTARAFSFMRNNLSARDRTHHLELQHFNGVFEDVEPSKSETA